MENPYPGWSTNYAAYCVAHGMTPEQMEQHDGDSMVNFIGWINRHKHPFRQQHPEALCCGDIADYDKWADFLLQSAYNAINSGPVHPDGPTRTEPSNLERNDEEDTKSKNHESRHRVE